MAFMALFGWLFILMIPAYFIGIALKTILTWAAVHIILVNVISAVLLVLNLLILSVLLKIWVRWWREGKWKASYARRDRTLKGFLGRFCLFYGIFLEFCAVLIFSAILIFQPVPYLAGLLL